VTRIDIAKKLLVGLIRMNTIGGHVTVHLYRIDEQKVQAFGYKRAIIPGSPPTLML
jgi:hypothetical protein